MTENGSPVADLTVARQGTAATTHRGRARDRRVADDEGQADRRTPSRRRGRLRPRPTRRRRSPSSPSTARSTSCRRSRRARARSRALSRTRRRSPTARRTTTRSPRRSQLIQKSGVPTGSIIILTDGQSVGNVAKPAHGPRRPRGRPRPRLLGRAQLARLQRQSPGADGVGDRRLLRRGDEPRQDRADPRSRSGASSRASTCSTTSRSRTRASTSTSRSRSTASPGRR